MFHFLFYPVGNSLCKVHFLQPSPPLPKSETAILIQHVFLPSFQALFTRPAPLTSSSPSYHSSVGDETGFPELEKGRMTSLTDRQTLKLELWDWNVAREGNHSFLRLFDSTPTLSWKKSRVRRKQIGQESEGGERGHSRTWATQKVVLPHLTCQSTLRTPQLSSNTEKIL